ncbi:N-acetylmuramoyl-L-alanine amidase [bacterium]|nr:N-acetylmuramoyl-L-alanine amidase [bacterium]
MMRDASRYILAMLTLLAASFPATAQQRTEKVLRNELSGYFSAYSNPAYSSNDKISIEKITVDRETRTLSIFVNEGFSSQPFTPQLVATIYDDVRARLRAEYRGFNLIIYAQGKRIQDLIPVSLQANPDSARIYRSQMRRGNPWVTPMSNPYNINNVLGGSHLCVWPSHGKYYRNATQKWVWQRPRLYCTSEDLLTQSFTNPYLIPMLENAGAVVYTPRERDWQKSEAVVDNDHPDMQGTYREEDGKHPWQTSGTGFAHAQQYYYDGDNPFEQGTCRMVEAVSGVRQLSTAVWQPQIPQEGDYAVYVSYQSLPGSVSDAVYSVRHQGIATEFRVNQQMGGGTWVYLGTFRFSAGCSKDNCVVLSNHSDYKGVITADAVRFGGGMSNVVRGDTTLAEACGSGLPRCLEAARYTAMWSGIPRWVYSVKENDDYGDDINSRPLSANYVARGSDYLPGDSGISVPIELCVAVHSDAGVRRDSSFIGSLSVYTSDFNEGLTAAGLSRLTSRDLSESVLTQIDSDMRRKYGSWNRRQMYDRNYGETREPQIPAIIIEMFSHQNWNDMRYAHDPSFKFSLARSIYKGIGRYLHCLHCKEGDFVPQPLPVSDLSAIVNEATGEIVLNWRPTEDPLEPLAMPSSYVVYASIDGKGFDNGTLTHSPTLTLPAREGAIYRFRIAAVNDGGRSMASDEVCAVFGGKDAPRILVVDGFSRTSAPHCFDIQDSCGFDMDYDPGVIDVRSPEYCGYQLGFDKNMSGKTGPNGLGYSGDELEGMILAGNTHDYCTLHARDIASAGRYNISSTAISALPFIRTSHFQLLDIIFGAQRYDENAVSRFKTFTMPTMEIVEEYTRGGGNVLVSGAYIGSDMSSEEEREFTKRVLKYEGVGTVRADSIPYSIGGNNISFSIFDSPSEQNYWVRSVDILSPVLGSYCTMLHGKNSASVAIAYQGEDYNVMAFGFPIECIRETEKRRAIITSAVPFLIGTQ